MTKQKKKKKVLIPSICKRNKISPYRLKRRQEVAEGKKWLTFVIIFFVGVLMIFSTYAWFSTTLNVKVKNFNMVVSRNSGLSISFDGINYDSYVEISRKALIDNLVDTYPTNTSQWASVGLTPVSSNGISNPNSPTFDIYASGGVRYRSKKKENGFVNLNLIEENERRAYNNYIAFDLFLKNVTGSPVNDNLYFDYGTEVKMDSESTEEMNGLVNSVRIGIVKIGSLPLDTNPTTLQGMTCNNNCKSIIFEPNSTIHSELSIERAKVYGINLKNEERFPTYACIKGGGPIYVKDAVSGSTNIDLDYFALQQTMTEDDFGMPLFEIPNAVTKVRVYVWIEGQDIDSLETNSDGADISISINFVKDTQGYNTYN